jgi:hypothetical protein
MRSLVPTQRSAVMFNTTGVFDGPLRKGMKSEWTSGHQGSIGVLPANINAMLKRLGTPRLGQVVRREVSMPS